MAAQRKAQIVFPDDLLHAVDRLVGRRKRSEFVVSATREKLVRIRFQDVLKKTAGAWSVARHPETHTQVTLTRWLKRTRRAAYL
jgi:metal-responsive CopG/Arc/MetJ family transcriptional regulator